MRQKFCQMQHTQYLVFDPPYDSYFANVALYDDLYEDDLYEDDLDDDLPPDLDLLLLLLHLPPPRPPPPLLPWTMAAEQANIIKKRKKENFIFIQRKVSLY